MPIDFTLELPCEPKRKLGLEGLSDRLRLLEDLHRELELTPEQTTSVREIVFELRPLAFHCGKCPGNHRNREFGCFGRIEVPISEDAEDWLWELLPPSLTPAEGDTPEQRAQIDATARLIERFQQLDITGRSADQRRPKRVPEGEAPLFAGEKPVFRTYGKAFRRVRLSTSQIIEALLLRNTIHTELGELICRALGIWQDGPVAEDGVPEMYFTQPIEGDDDPTVAQLKLLFYALMVAGSLDTNVLTEVHSDTKVAVPATVG